MSALFFSVRLALGASACGGATATVPGEDDGGGSDSGADAVADASSEGSADGAKADPCVQLLMNVEMLDQPARKCCSTCHSIQCGQLVQGVCCPFSVTDPSSPNVVAYEAALKTYLSQCRPACPQTPCPANPSFDCDANLGTCR
jgi:hypothetical protein